MEPKKPIDRLDLRLRDLGVHLGLCRTFGEQICIDTGLGIQEERSLPSRREELLRLAFRIVLRCRTGMKVVVTSH